MKKARTAVLLIAVLALAEYGVAEARSGGGHSGGGRSGGGHSSGAHSGGGHSSGGHGYSHGYYRPYYGSRIVVGGAPYYPYYAYPGYYYPYPASSYYTPVPAPVYIEQPAPEAQGDWFYCAQFRAYYPQVQECPGGWQRVAPQPR